jgi:hypothetical protein
MGRSRQYSQAPFDDALGHQTKDWQDWVTVTLNALQGQNMQGQNLQASGFTALNNPSVNPASSQVQSFGARVASLTTSFTFTTTSTTISIFWDGTNNSLPLKIFRDDGTVAGPFPGNQTITGLSPSTTYYFAVFFDETAQVVRFVSQAGAVGSPPVAYLSPLIAVGQQQILRGHTPLASDLFVTGITTPASGSTTPVVLGGGGAGAGAYLGRKLAPL